MMTTYPSYKAPTLDPTLVLLRNRLLTRCASWSTPFGSGQADWVVLQATPDFPAVCRLELMVGTECWSIYINDLSCLLCHEAFSSSETPISLSDLPHSVQKAVLNALLIPVINAMQDATGKPASIKNIELPTTEKLPQAEGFGLKICFSGEQSTENVMFAYLVPSSKQAVIQAAEQLASLPLIPNPGLTGTIASIPLEVAMETGYLSLDIEEMQALAVEDLLLPAVWSPSENRAFIRIYQGTSSVLVGECSLENDAAILETPLANEVDTCMDSNITNDIEIRLSFELDRRLISVGELASIAPGFTFPLNSTNDSLVTVRANGKAIARGRIVDMNGTIGVQLTETL